MVPLFMLKQTSLSNMFVSLHENISVNLINCIRTFKLFGKTTLFLREILSAKKITDDKCFEQTMLVCSLVLVSGTRLRLSGVSVQCPSLALLC